MNFQAQKAIVILDDGRMYFLETLGIRRFFHIVNLSCPPRPINID